MDSQQTGRSDPMDSQQATGMVLSSKLFLVLYFLFKILPLFVCAFSIYLGYKLFVLGVTGQASLVVNANSLRGQLVNAAPGLFFAVGGIVGTIVLIWRGVTVDIGPKLIRFLKITRM